MITLKSYRHLYFFMIKSIISNDVFAFLIVLEEILMNNTIWTVKNKPTVIFNLKSVGVELSTLIIDLLINYNGEKMKYIKLSELKNQAKKDRKNNTNIKNHSESLDLIAKKYDFSSWANLIDGSAIIIPDLSNKDRVLSSITTPEGKKLYQDELDEYIIDRKQKDRLKLANNLVNKIQHSIIYFYEIFESGNPKIVAHYFEEVFKSDGELGRDQWNKKSIELIKVIYFIYFKTKKKKIDIKHFLSLLPYEKLMNTVDKEFHDFSQLPLINMFLNEVLSGYNFNEEITEQSISVKKEYGSLSMEYISAFEIISETMTLFAKGNIGKKEIIDILKQKNNLPIFLNNPFFKNSFDSPFDDYIRNINTSKLSIFNSDLFKIHLDTMNQI